MGRTTNYSPMKRPFYLSNNRADAGRIAQVVLPYPDDTDSSDFEEFVGLAVALAITADFCLPEISPRLRNMATLATAMPKTSVDKYHQLAATKIEIWFSTDRCRVEYPALDPSPNKCHLERNLCRSVVFAANCRHGSRTLPRNVAKPAVFKFGFKESFHLGHGQENGSVQ